MSLISTSCSYHPNMQAVAICERCRRPICLNDQRIYRRRRSRSRGYYRWTEQYLYCVACNADKLRSDANRSIVVGAFFVVFLLVLGVGTGNGPLIAILAAVLIVASISAFNKASRAGKEKQGLYASSTTHNTLRNAQTAPVGGILHCYECGNPLKGRVKFCTQCGDSTQDELRDSLGYRSG